MQSLQSFRSLPIPIKKSKRVLAAGLCTEEMSCSNSRKVARGFLHRFQRFGETSLPHLPPTSAAAYQHLCRVDYQAQVWLGNELDPENWGWVFSNCQSKSYSNVESNTTDEDAYDINEDISDPPFFLESEEEHISIEEFEEYLDDS
ncbi:hypothetical protein AVEN_12860-1 [Araneus ventricosus]|uniref:Uncharacterized protein n=1 Tax=Araneus ventricosus TaxID=182803 RepID=A0A4Y2VRA0_ARAVE|nr:hypothetical protein AVEN_12860-1 [Araneus ventricosus]